LDCVGLLVVVCFNDIKNENKIYHVSFFCVFLVVWQDMLNEVGEIVFKMEENMNNPMNILQSFVDQIFVK